MGGRKKQGRKIPWMIIFLILILSSFLIFFLLKKPNSVELEILEKVKRFPEVQDYKSYPANVTFLTKDDLAKLAENYPVIYGNITNDAYEIKFLSGDKDLLVLYDENQNKIIRAFEIIGVKIG